MTPPRSDVRSRPLTPTRERRRPDERRAATPPGRRLGLAEWLVTLMLAALAANALIGENPGPAGPPAAASPAPVVVLPPAVEPPAESLPLVPSPAPASLIGAGGPPLPD